MLTFSLASCKGIDETLALAVANSPIGDEETFEVFVSGGERPISTVDTNFFDRILIIPVAFLMSFFGGLVGNSFGLAILFTTLVIRTLACRFMQKVMTYQ